MLTRAEALGGLHAGEPHVEELRAGVELAANPQEEGWHRSSAPCGGGRARCRSPHVGRHAHGSRGPALLLSTRRGVL